MTSQGDGKGRIWQPPPFGNIKSKQQYKTTYCRCPKIVKLYKLFYFAFNQRKHLTKSSYEDKV